ncbi:DUF4214 domain-containing protein [Motiliproteus sp. MSK22-1]|uniref:DUF4214 domain-containing protein n=1 Tax=Motiliproteus sp. MSK22-1 TaxID=1897630 RepID=UPI000978A8C5|nr:DUF4214 domain-containing protein [Motiliproteus sp. MSK22-1]OMH26627.1 hypothetical protein BGP75_23305 [Motiliproteus sp. MSK22-1]
MSLTDTLVTVQEPVAATVEFDFVRNSLDLVIDGLGYFQLDDGQGGVSYTREGKFELDKDGHLVSVSGKYLQGFGLSADGNQQPIGNMALSQTESSPTPTSNIDLSININSDVSATDLLGPYDMSDSSTFSFSTTTHIVDSLGDENALRFDFVEQSSVHERQTATFTTAIRTGSIQVAGVNISLEEGDSSAEIALLVAAQETAVRMADPRVTSVVVDPANTNNVLITYAASAADVEEIIVTDVGDTGVISTIVSNPYLAANEVQMVEISAPTATAQIFFGGVAIDVSNTTIAADTAADVVNRVIAKQGEIIEATPAIESLAADLSSVPPRIIITYKPEEGDVAQLVVDENGTGVFHGTDLATTVENGDNSYQGVYQLYAYLNGNELLDIGKQVAAGATGSIVTPRTTEPGPVLLIFDPEDGTLRSVNGTSVDNSGIAPELILIGADPADPSHLPNLDLSGTTLSATESAVISETHDGFVKGDLISLTVSYDGILTARFSNGQESNLGIIALAIFESSSNLQAIDNNEWLATLESGQAIFNPPAEGMNGELKSAFAEYDGDYGDYKVTVTTSGFFIVPIAQPSQAETVIGVDRIQFADTNLALDINGTAGQVYRIYKAAFDRTPDAEGLGFWIDTVEHGGTLQNVAAGFIHSNEFQTLYGDNPSNELFLTSLYHNVLDRDPDQDGFQWWSDKLNSGAESREDILVDFSESPENQANVIDLIGDGIVYEEWLG